MSSSVSDGIEQYFNKICSQQYQEMFENAAKNQPIALSHEEQSMLTTIPNKIDWYEGQDRIELVERVRQNHLKWFNKWLTEFGACQPPYIIQNSLFDRIMLHVTNLLFRIDRGDIITSDDTRQDCLKIMMTDKDILTKISQLHPTNIEQEAISFVQNLLQILFYFTIDNDLAIHLKNLHLVDLMNQLLQTSNDHTEIHFNIYRILAVIMTQNDIKQLKNSDRIASVFISSIDDIIDNGESSKDRLHNSLRSCKVLTQHDEIREELIKQEGYQLFLRCALEDQFDPLRAKLPALEILLALAFNKDFALKLKNNDEFMNHLRSLKSSDREELRRVATAFIWKLETESETKIPTTSTSKTSTKRYDIMISYSHSDKELCYRVFNALEEDKRCVWIDSQLMHGATFDAMAEAIENSDFVFICMSDAYKQSPFCKMEASYAIKRRCHIIPLVMTSNYKADGWLGVLTSPFIYVDFPKLGFERAYQELKKQFDLLGKDERKSEQIQHNPIVIENNVSKPVLTAMRPKEPRPVVEYPHCLTEWSEEQVKSYLLDKDLDAFLPVFDGMNGQVLLQAYSMCLTNQQAMYISMKDDIAKSGSAVLTLKDYLKFLKEIKIYVPIVIGTPVNPASAVCNLM